MQMKILRIIPVPAVIVAALAASAIATGANPRYCDPLSGCKTHFVKVSPSTVRAGHATTVSGAVANGCKRRRVTLYSKAFKGAARHRFAGVPAIFTTANRKGKFSARVTIKRRIKAGRYRVAGRCSGGNFGSATLRVKHG